MIQAWRNFLFSHLIFHGLSAYLRQIFILEIVSAHYSMSIPRTQSHSVHR